MKSETKLFLDLVDQVNHLYYLLGYDTSSFSSFIVQLRVVGTGTSITRFVYQLCVADKVHKVIIEEFASLQSLFVYCKSHDIDVNKFKLYLYGKQN